MIVEDDRLSSRYFKDVLVANSFKAKAVSNAAAALRALDQKPFDGVVLDLVLPGINGRWLMERMQENDQWSTIPIIIVSAYLTKVDYDILADLGVQHVLPKPVSIDLLLDAVRSVAPSL